MANDEQEKAFAEADTAPLMNADVHYADKEKCGLSTLCGKPIPPAKASPYEKDVTCPECIGVSNWRAIPHRPRFGGARGR
jgi:hypothetical protein